MVLGRHADWGRGKKAMGKTHKVQYILKDRRTYIHTYICTHYQEYITSYVCTLGTHIHTVCTYKRN